MIAACHDFAEEAISIQTPPAEVEVLEENDVVEEKIPDQPPHQEDATTENRVTPMFGSRRVAADKPDEDSEVTPAAEATVEPLFRRRRAVS